MTLTMPRRSRLLPVLLVLSLFAGAFTPQPVLAIGELDESGELQDFEESDPTPYYKGIGTGVGVVLTFFVCWFLIYPSILRRGQIWPVSLFGITTSLAWILGWVIALSVYWDDLPIPPGETFWQGWGLRLAGIGLAALFGILCLVFWRSEPAGRAG